MLGSILKYPIIPKTLLTQARSIQGIMQKSFIHDKNIFSAIMAVRMFLTRHARLSDGVLRSSFLKPNGLLQNVSIQNRQMSQLDVNINVQNNVILYKFERNSYFRNVRIFGFGQLFGWSVLAFYTYKSSFWDIFTTDIKFKEYYFNHMFRLGLFFFSIVAGPSMLFFIYALCARNIKYIILNKGGKTLSIVTYHMRKKKSNINLPIGMIKCVTDRNRARCVALKIENKPFYYLIDAEGTFVNPKLFDHATG